MLFKIRDRVYTEETFFIKKEMAGSVMNEFLLMSSTYQASLFLLCSNEGFILVYGYHYRHLKSQICDIRLETAAKARRQILLYDVRVEKRVHLLSYT